MQMEGEFLFPIPTDRATMSNFVLWMDGKKLTFETMDAMKARSIYETIVRQMRDPGLLEFVEDGLLRCRIFPIPANGTKTIELEYQEILDKAGSMTRYAFPLGIKGLPEPISNLLIDIEIKSDKPMAKVYSPTHNVSINMIDSRHARITMEKSGYLPTRELVVLISNPESQFGVDLITHKKRGEDGYFISIIAPRFDYKTTERKPVPKDFMFILDTSGSMEGQKIVQAKEALKFILRNLNPDDRFALINFSNEVHNFGEGLLPVSKANSAIEYVNTLSADGGTFIDGALKEGLSFVTKSDRPFYIIFLTDGLPTIGEQNIDVILDNARKANERDARIFAFGVGDDVNIPFIDRLSEENGGIYTNVSPTEDIEIPLSDLYRKIKSPVLTDLEFSIDGVKVYDVYPQKLPDLFEGSQLVITGRYTGDGKAKVRLKGKLGGSTVKTFSYNLKFDSRNERNYIPSLWANRKVGYLQNQLRLYGDNEEMIDQVKLLANQFGIITPYTSYLVLEGDQLDKLQLGNLYRSRSSPLGGVAKNPASPGFGGKQGAAARKASKGLQSQTYAGNLSFMSDEEEMVQNQNVQQVNHKTFIQREIFWVDTEFDEGAKLVEVNVVFMSEKYFELIDQYPGINDYLSVGDNIKFVWDNQVFIINAEEE